MGHVNAGLCAVLAIVLIATEASGQVYKQVRPDGTVYYSDKPPPSVTGSTELKPDIRSRAARPEDDPIFAAMNVYGNETMVETFYRFCRKAVPESEPAVRQARDQWNARNFSLLAKKLVVLQDQFSRQQLLKIAGETEATHEQILQKVRSATAAEQVTWCKAAPVRYDAYEMNPSRNPTIVKTLESYTPKAPRR